MNMIDSLYWFCNQILISIFHHRLLSSFLLHTLQSTERAAASWHDEWMNPMIFLLNNWNLPHYKVLMTSHESEAKCSGIFRDEILTDIYIFLRSDWFICDDAKSLKFVELLRDELYPKRTESHNNSFSFSFLGGNPRARRWRRTR